MTGLLETAAELREALHADLLRNGGAGPRLTLAIFRVGQYLHGSRHPLSRVLRPLWRAVDVLYLRTLLHAEFPPGFRCGPGLSLPHAGRGVVIHPEATLGENSMVYQRVTIGARNGGAPAIANDVTIGAGACVLGPIHIGEHSKVGANAVVVKDVAPWTSVGGVPATPLGVPAES